jgi:hypothetical protein
MNAAEMAANIGKTGLLSTEKTLQITVKISDVRQVFGRLDYLVSPANGTGSTWVESSRVTVLS